jgi:hypothetical protein
MQETNIPYFGPITIECNALSFYFTYICVIMPYRHVMNCDTLFMLFYEIQESAKRLKLGFLVQNKD